MTATREALFAYVAEHGVTPTEAARALGVNPRVARRWAAAAREGSPVPSPAPPPRPRPTGKVRVRLGEVDATFRDQLVEAVRLRLAFLASVESLEDPRASRDQAAALGAMIDRVEGLLELAGEPKRPEKVDPAAQQERRRRLLELVPVPKGGDR